MKLAASAQEQQGNFSLRWRGSVELCREACVEPACVITVLVLSCVLVP